jgi:phenylpropionate dioxygenase-like ring-hydroxylating dioxygenase large terminal subunit
MANGAYDVMAFSTVDEQGRNFKAFEGLDKRWDKEAEYITFYPNVMFGVHKDHTFGIVLEPKSSSQTLEHIELYYASDEMQTDNWQDMRQTNAAFWKEVFSEDVGVVEAMQEGRKADGFDGGHFSPVMDESTHHFHRWVAGHFVEVG